MSLEVVMTPTMTFALAAGASTLALMSAGGAVLAIPALRKMFIPNPNETKLAEYIPYASILPDGRTVVQNDGSYSLYFVIEGIDQNFLDINEQISFGEVRKKFYEAMGEKKAVIRLHTFREKIDVNSGYKWPNEITTEIARRWNNQFNNAYKTLTILCVTFSVGKSEKENSKIRDIIEQVDTFLHSYKPRLVTQNVLDDPNGKLFLGSLLGKMVSPITRPAPRLFGGHLSEALVADELEFFSNGRILRKSGNEEIWQLIINIQRFGDDVSTALARDLASVPADIEIFQWIKPQSRGMALAKMKQEQRMSATTSFSPSVYSQYQEVVEMLEGLDDRSACLCQYAETIMISCESENRLEEIERHIKKIIIHHGATPVVEKGASQAAWFGRFPTYDYHPRQFRLMSDHVAVLNTFEQPVAGIDDSSWGKGPIALFNTGSNTVYSHQMHVNALKDSVAHGVAIAPTGSGKTVFFMFMSLMASRHKNLRHFFFDRYKGTYCYTSAIGGKYLSLNANKLTQSIAGGLNPFQLPDTEENRQFLSVWLQGISGLDDFDSIEQIGNAIDYSYTLLDQNERSLMAIYDAAFTENSPVKNALKKWIDPNQYGGFVNAEQDCLDVEDSWLTTFDMTNLLEDPNLAGPSTNYIMHRIRQVLRDTNSGGYIFMDETEPLLRNENFKKQFLIALQEYRKLGAGVISVFQRPSALRDSGISELIRQQCKTYYLFPNPGSAAADYSDFDLTDKEMAFVLGNWEPPRATKRSILVKRPENKESVIIDVDLKPLGDAWLRVFSSGSGDIQLANQFQAQYGDEWIKPFLTHKD